VTFGAEKSRGRYTPLPQLRLVLNIEKSRTQQIRLQVTVCVIFIKCNLTVRLGKVSP
jgi:hypothetical protein